MEVTFPIYRKSAGGNSFYEILNEISLREIQVIGSKYVWHNLEAKIYPEKLFIKDLIELSGDSFVGISRDEFLKFVALCSSTKMEWIS
ncbi:MAG: hypothetical protein SGI87_10125 [Flavobacteriales bacterium]|nr:hypothetical protein [Flavobacteriales bacterium]